METQYRNIYIYIYIFHRFRGNKRKYDVSRRNISGDVLYAMKRQCTYTHRADEAIELMGARARGS